MTLDQLKTSGLFTEPLNLPPRVSPQPPIGTPPLDPWRLELHLKPLSAKVHGLMPPTAFWSYEGSVPGPTVVVNSGERVRVKFINELGTSAAPVFVPFSSHTIPAATPHPMNSTGSEGTSADSRLNGLSAWTVTHLHGAPSQADSDGWTDNVAGPSELDEKVYAFPVEKYSLPTTGAPLEFEGGIAPTYWYHDHAMGVTRFNVYAGLAGMWLVRHPIETALELPVASHELALVIQDRNFETDDTTPAGNLTGRLLHKIQEDIMECFCPATLVNGKLWPQRKVDAQVYRLRIVNGSNARFYRLHFTGQKTANQSPPDLLPARFVQQIGTDGGLLAAAIDLPMLTKPDGTPVADAGCLLLAPGERADLLVDFGGIMALGYQFVTVFNSAPAPYGFESEFINSASDIFNPDLDKLRLHPEVMRFELAGPPVPGKIQGRKLLGNRFHRITHAELPDSHDHTLIVLREENGMLFLHEMMEESMANKMGMNMHKVFVPDPASTPANPLPDIPAGIRVSLPEKPHGTWEITNYVTVAKGFDDATTIHIEKDSWRVWKILNLSPDTHPFHIHLVQFQGLSRTIFTPTSNMRPAPAGGFEFAFENPAALETRDLETNERGWKDTIRVNPGGRDANDDIVSAELLTLAAQFTGHAGRYMYHCHILEHEDQEMMRPFVVMPSALMAFAHHKDHEMSGTEATQQTAG